MQIRHLGNRITRGNVRGNARRPARVARPGPRRQERIQPRQERRDRLQALQAENQQPDGMDGPMPQMAPEA